MRKELKPKSADVIIINDNNLGYLGGERESQLILINELSRYYKIAVIQPGVFSDTIDNVHFYWCTKERRIKYLIKNPFAFLIYIIKVARLINDISPKLIHSNSQVSLFMISLMMRFHLISRNIRFVHTDRGLYTKYNGFFRWLFFKSFKYLDTLVTTTCFNKECWSEANEKRAINLCYRVIGNTAGKEYETMDLSKLPENSPLTVGFAGRMCDWKGWPLAEDICSEIDKVTQNVQFEMCVSCFDESAEEETKELFSRMKSKYKSRFTGRINVPFHEMEQFYYNIDVYILTSWPKSESFGRTIVEAMSRYTAVLTTDAGGAVEVVNKPHTVCKSAVEFAEKVQFWSAEKDVLLHEKMENLERVHKFYTFENNISNYLELYRNEMRDDYSGVEIYV